MQQLQRQQQQPTLLSEWVDDDDDFYSWRSVAIGGGRGRQRPVLSHHEWEDEEEPSTVASSLACPQVAYKALSQVLLKRLYWMYNHDLQAIRRLTDHNDTSIPLHFLLKCPDILRSLGNVRDILFTRGSHAALKEHSCSLLQEQPSPEKGGDGDGDVLLTEALLSNLRLLPSLQQLNLQNFGIRDLSFLAELENLEHAILDNNLISTISLIEKNRQTKLRTLSFVNNPVQTLSLHSLISTFPNLEVLFLPTTFLPTPEIQELAHRNRLSLRLGRRLTEPAGSMELACSMEPAGSMELACSMETAGSKEAANTKETAGSKETAEERSAAYDENLDPNFSFASKDHNEGSGLPHFGVDEINCRNVDDANNTFQRNGDGRDIARGDGRDIARGDGRDIARADGRDVARADGRDIARGDGDGRDIARGDGDGRDIARGDGDGRGISRGDGDTRKKDGKQKRQQQRRGLRSSEVKTLVSQNSQETEESKKIRGDVTSKKGDTVKKKRAERDLGDIGMEVVPPCIGEGVRIGDEVVFRKTDKTRRDKPGTPNLGKSKKQQQHADRLPPEPLTPATIDRKSQTIPMSPISVPPTSVPLSSMSPTSVPLGSMSPTSVPVRTMSPTSMSPISMSPTASLSQASSASFICPSNSSTSSHSQTMSLIAIPSPLTSSSLPSTSPNPRVETSKKTLSPPARVPSPSEPKSPLSSVTACQPSTNTTIGTLLNLGLPTVDCPVPARRNLPEKPDVHSSGERNTSATAVVTMFIKVPTTPSSHNSHKTTKEMEAVCARESGNVCARESDNVCARESDTVCARGSDPVCARESETPSSNKAMCAKEEQPFMEESSYAFWEEFSRDFDEADEQRTMLKRELDDLLIELETTRHEFGEGIKKLLWLREAFLKCLKELMVKSDDLDFRKCADEFMCVLAARVEKFVRLFVDSNKLADLDGLIEMKENSFLACLGLFCYSGYRHTHDGESIAAKFAVKLLEEVKQLGEYSETLIMDFMSSQILLKDTEKKILAHLDSKQMESQQVENALFNQLIEAQSGGLNELAKIYLTHAQQTAHAEEIYQLIKILDVQLARISERLEELLRKNDNP